VLSLVVGDPFMWNGGFGVVLSVNEETDVVFAMLQNGRHLEGPVRIIAAAKEHLMRQFS
jgi:hypothetical protein